MRFLPTAALALIFTGCSGKGSDDDASVDGGDDDDAPVVETIDTSGPDTKTAAEVRFRAFIAWDAAQRQIVSPIIASLSISRCTARRSVNCGWSPELRCIVPGLVSRSKGVIR